MSKTVVIHQPDFMPYLGFFQRFLQADLYIVLDHVQFISHSGKSWQHRDKIKTEKGESWLSLSVKKASLGTPINQIELATETDWPRTNLNLIAHNYRSAPFFHEIMPYVEKLYANPPKLLAEFNMNSIRMVMDLTGIDIPIVFSSTMDPQGNKTELLIDLLQKTGATHYLSGIGSKAYLLPEAFEKTRIKLFWQEFNHPTYPQQFGEFIPFLSALDALMNCGALGTKELLKGTLP